MKQGISDECYSKAAKFEYKKNRKCKDLKITVYIPSKYHFGNYLSVSTCLKCLIFV